MVIDAVRLCRGLISCSLWIRGFYVRAHPDRVFTARVFMPRWPHPQPFERRCGNCNYRGRGLPGDGCPSCGAGAEDGVPA